jgi:hypothetical protein
LIDEVADGARDFDPSPTLVKSMTRKGTLMETSLCIWERWFCHL